MPVCSDYTYAFSTTISLAGSAGTYRSEEKKRGVRRRRRRRRKREGKEGGLGRKIGRRKLYLATDVDISTLL